MSQKPGVENSKRNVNTVITGKVSWSHDKLIILNAKSQEVNSKASSKNITYEIKN